MELMFLVLKILFVLVIVVIALIYCEMLSEKIETYWKEKQKEDMSRHAQVPVVTMKSSQKIQSTTVLSGQSREQELREHWGMVEEQE